MAGRDEDGLYPHQRDMLAWVDFKWPEGEVRPFGFDRSRYGKSWRHATLGPTYGGKLSDYMVQLRNGSSPENRIDDVFDRRLKKLRDYCMADVWLEAVWYDEYQELELVRFLLIITGRAVVHPKYRLKAPYGNDATGNRGTHISIQWRGATGIALGDGTVDPPWPTRQQADMIGGLTIGWGCPEFIAKKVSDAMFGSGRYDCIVTVSEVSLRNLDNALEQMGATVVVIRANYRNHRESEFK